MQETFVNSKRKAHQKNARGTGISYPLSPSIISQGIYLVWEALWFKLLR